MTPSAGPPQFSTVRELVQAMEDMSWNEHAVAYEFKISSRRLSRMLREDPRYRVPAWLVEGMIRCRQACDEALKPYAA